MNVYVGLIERVDLRSPSFQERSLSASVAEARRELGGMAEARALARIASVARREAAALDRPAPGSPLRPAFNVCIDAFALARDELDNLAHLACRSRDLDRACLPSTGELVDLLSSPAIAG